MPLEAGAPRQYAGSGCLIRRSAAQRTSASAIRRIGPRSSSAGTRTAAGEYLAVMGESGLGKSTLLNLAAVSINRIRGECCSKGVDLSTLDDDAVTLLRRRAVGIRLSGLSRAAVSQRRAKRRLPLRSLGSQRPERSRRTAQMLTGWVSPIADRYARELSRRSAAHRHRARSGASTAVCSSRQPTGISIRAARRKLWRYYARSQSQCRRGLLITHSRAAAETATAFWCSDAAAQTRARRMNASAPPHFPRCIADLARALLGNTRVSPPDCWSRAGNRLSVALAPRCIWSMAPRSMNLVATNDWWVKPRRRAGPREGFSGNCLLDWREMRRERGEPGTELEVALPATRHAEGIGVDPFRAARCHRR